MGQHEKIIQNETRTVELTAFAGRCTQLDCTLRSRRRRDKSVICQPSNRQPNFFACFMHQKCQQQRVCFFGCQRGELVATHACIETSPANLLAQALFFWGWIWISCTTRKNTRPSLGGKNADALDLRNHGYGLIDQGDVVSNLVLCKCRSYLEISYFGRLTTCTCCCCCCCCCCRFVSICLMVATTSYPLPASRHEPTQGRVDTTAAGSFSRRFGDIRPRSGWFAWLADNIIYPSCCSNNERGCLEWGCWNVQG